MRIGVYSPFFGATIGGGEKYLGVTLETIRDEFPAHTIELLTPVPVDRERYERMLKLDLHGIELAATNRKVTRFHRFLNGLPTARLYRDLAVSAQAVQHTRHYDLFVAMVYVMPAFSRARRSVMLCQFPYRVGRAANRRRGLGKVLYSLYSLPDRLLRPRLVGNDLDRFDPIICQSDYVRHWVREYWGRDALVVNPPIDVPEAEPDWRHKRRVVLGVGRFFAVGHAKRHDLMVKAFQELCEEGLKGWELHLAGSVHTEAHNAGYYERVESMARGFPIHLHPNASYDQVQRLYRQASIYWHAAGFGVNARADPINLEHFGMTTAEAMGHGAVPVAIGLGGQPEVVTHGVDGFLWQDLAGLKAWTRRLADDPRLRRRMGEAARQAAFRFSRAEFKRQMAEALRPVVAELEPDPNPLQGLQVAL